MRQCLIDNLKNKKFFQNKTSFGGRKHHLAARKHHLGALGYCPFYLYGVKNPLGAAPLVII